MVIELLIASQICLLNNNIKETPSSTKHRPSPASLFYTEPSPSDFFLHWSKILLAVRETIYISFGIMSHNNSYFHATHIWDEFKHLNLSGISILMYSPSLYSEGFWISPQKKVLAGVSVTSSLRKHIYSAGLCCTTITLLFAFTFFASLSQWKKKILQESIN